MADFTEYRRQSEDGGKWKSHHQIHYVETQACTTMIDKLSP